MTQLNLLVLKTDKMAGQAAFYSALGFTFEQHRHGNGPLHYASTGSNPVLEIYPLPKNITTPDSTSRLGFVVEDLVALVTTLQEINVTIVSPPAQTEWGFTAVVQDPDGRKIELTQR